MVPEVTVGTGVNICASAVVGVGNTAVEVGDGAVDSDVAGTGVEVGGIVVKVGVSDTSVAVGGA